MLSLRRLFRRPPKVDRAEAIASASMFLVETLTEVMVRTTYGLTYQGVAAMYRASADHLINNADHAENATEAAALLLMAKEISDMADRLETKHN